MSISAEAFYVQMGRLIEAIPDLRSSGNLSPATLQWLGRAEALVFAGSPNEIGQLRDAINWVMSPGLRDDGAQKLLRILYRVLAFAEISAPVALQGSFINAGSSLDAMAAVGRVLTEVSGDVLIVDPYMDEKTLFEFAPMTKLGAAVRLLSDAATHKDTLGPAARRWISQHGDSRPLAVKLAPSRSLHDRLIIVDNNVVWVLTQSLNAFAARAPASIVRVNDETAGMKVAAYRTIWGNAAALEQQS